MFKYVKIFILFNLFYLIGFSQPNLRIDPGNIKFENVFNRIEFTSLINNGNQVLNIDSISFLKPHYLVDFQNGRTLPFSMNPGDTVRMNVTLTNFYNITVADTSDTLFIYSNNPEGPDDLRIKIDFFDDDDRGLCTGQITDELLSPIENTKIYLMYWGIYLLDSTYTDAAGNYSLSVPEGSYTVAAEKNGYRVMFYGNTPDPYFAQPVQIDSGQTVNVNMTLPPVINSGFTVSGRMIDSVGGITLDKGVVVVRKGNHTPTLLKQGGILTDSSVYAGFVKGDGSYSIIVDDSAYYYVQGYSDYFLPTYYNDGGISSVFWQNADSVFISSNIVDKDLFVVRDSSYGGGNASGLINLTGLESVGFDGISVLAKSVNNNGFYSYNFTKQNGGFRVSNLPFGTYQLVAQKVGYNQAMSEPFTIDSLNSSISNLTINFLISDVVDENFIPEHFVLHQNYPNPFNPSTKIRYTILTPPQSSPLAKGRTEEGFITLKVYDVLGNQVATLVDEFKEAGLHEVTFNASRLASGIYFYTIKSSKFIETKKMILLK